MTSWCKNNLTLYDLVEDKHNNTNGIHTLIFIHEIGSKLLKSRLKSVLIFEEKVHF